EADRAVAGEQVDEDGVLGAGAEADDAELVDRARRPVRARPAGAVEVALGGEEDRARRDAAGVRSRPRRGRAVGEDQLRPRAGVVGEPPERPEVAAGDAQLL